MDMNEVGYVIFFSSELKVNQTLFESTPVSTISESTTGNITFLLLSLYIIFCVIKEVVSKGKERMRF